MNRRDRFVGSIQAGRRFPAVYIFVCPSNRARLDDPIWFVELDIDNDCLVDEGCADSDGDGIPDAIDNCPPMRRERRNDDA